MCTLTLAWQAFDDAPVVVAANRDEELDREADPPGVYRDEPLVIAPQDAEAGGTWIGFNEHGVFVGITNRWNDADLAGERSRGLLVGDALECETAEAATAFLEQSVEAVEYEGFNLVVADADDAVWFGWDGSLERVDLEPGVHVVVNVGFDDRFSIPAGRASVGEQQAANARDVRRELEPESGEDADAWLERAASVLGDHEYGVCIHGDGFGTRSSSLIALEAPSSPASARYEFAAGPPCQASYERVGVSLEGERATAAAGSDDGNDDGERHI